MKHTVRSFSIGLLTAGLIMLVVFYIAEDTGADQADLSVEEMIAAVENEGYRVITESEYISFSVGNGQEEVEEETDPEPEEEVNEEEESTEETNAEEEDPVEENDTSANEDEQEEEENVPDENEAEEEIEEDDTPSTVTINIASGTPSLELSYNLEELNLVEDAIEFNDYLQQNGYALRIQLGEHELQQGMSYFEIAEELTN